MIRFPSGLDSDRIVKSISGLVPFLRIDPKLMKAGVMPVAVASPAEWKLRTMTFTKLIVVGTGALVVGLFAAGAHPGQIEPAQTPAAVPPQVTATPQSPASPPAETTPSAAAPARADERVRGAQSGAALQENKPLAVFFEIHDRARSVAYVIDRSGSMAVRNSLDVAKRELLASLSQLPPDSQFAVIFYNMTAWTLRDDQGHAGLMAASASNRKEVQSQIAKVAADGGTDHMVALRTALTLKPDVIFFLTDADLMTNNDVDEVLEEMGKAPKPAVGTNRSLMASFRMFMNGFSRPAEVQKTRIQVIELGRGPEVTQDAPLRRLATTTDGSYLYLDVQQFPKVGR
jgi:hypothetical protein